MKKNLFNKFITKVIPSLADQSANLNKEEQEEQEKFTPNPNDPADVTFAKVFTNNDNIVDRTLMQNNQNISIRMSYPYRPLFVEIIFVFFRFLGFLCCVNAFSIGSLISHGELISSFSLAWIIGLIVPAAPGGLGVFESVILFSLSSHLPEAPLLASLLCYRLVSTVSDILAALIYPVKKLLKV